jgi:hypothetical protein
LGDGPRKRAELNVINMMRADWRLAGIWAWGVDVKRLPYPVRWRDRSSEEMKLGLEEVAGKRSRLLLGCSRPAD